MTPAKKLPKTSRRPLESKDRAAATSLMEELFSDMYEHRHRLYRLNFVRGVFYGFGTALGGTVLLAIVFWILSWFVDWPYIGQFIERIMQQ